MFVKKKKYQATNSPGTQNRNDIFNIILIILICFTFLHGCGTGSGSTARFQFNSKDHTFEISYKEKIIAKGTLEILDSTGKNISRKENPIVVKTEKLKSSEGDITQHFIFQGKKEGIQLHITGILGGTHTFLCAPEKNEELSAVIRVSSGSSLSRINTGVYSQSEDWVLYFSDNNNLTFNRPGDQAPDTFFPFVKYEADQIVLVFKPGLYKDHLDIRYYDSSLAHKKKAVPCGWISWKAYGGGITEKDVKKATDWCTENLGDYGLDYIIVDDGWFQGGSPSGQMYNVPPGIDWTQANWKFPSGIQHLTDYIHDRSLKAGIWISPFGFSGDPHKNPDYWIRTGKGKDFLYNEWHGFHYCDSTNKDAVTQWLTRGVRAQNENRVDLFKLDGMFHIAYEGYQKTGDYFPAKGYTWQTALRIGWNALYDAAGGGYVLSCWGRVPEIAGIPDAIRIGQDKDSKWIYIPIVAEDLYSYLYEHNILWCDDPDHIVFRDLSPAESRTWATLVGITGTLLTFSDKPENMTREKLSILRKILPVINKPAVRPLNLFPYKTPPRLWTMEIDRSFDHWLVAANTTASGTMNEIVFDSIGLDPDKEYMVFDFWNEKFRGIYKKSFYCGIPGKKDSAVYCIKELRSYPWVISVNRHISQGGVSINTLYYDNNILSGTVKVVKNDPYSLFIYTHGRTINKVDIDPACEYNLTVSGHTAQLTITSTKTEPVSWSISFGKKDSALSPIKNETLNPALAEASELNKEMENKKILYLSDIPWKSALNAWGPVERDMSNGEAGQGDGIPITIGGKSYAKGLGVHADSTIVYSLGNGFTQFRAAIGIDDETLSNGTVIFRVFVDGQKKFESKIIQGGDPPDNINVDISDKKELTLEVSGGPDGITYDHADWADARIIK